MTRSRQITGLALWTFFIIICLSQSLTLQYRKQLSLYDDPLDFFVYRKAQQVFKQRLQEYQIKRFLNKK